MNNRIRELARESGIDIYGLGKDRAKWESTLEKFTELLVGECATMVDKATGRRGTNTIGAVLKTHFGVEQ